MSGGTRQICYENLFGKALNGILLSASMLRLQWHGGWPYVKPCLWLASLIFLDGLPQRLAKPAVLDEQCGDGNRQDNRRRLFPRNTSKHARQPGTQKRDQQQQ